MGWSLHETPIQKAVEDGLVERINAVAKTNYSRQEWLALQQSECIDQEQWDQEYCCLPADESAAFFPYDMITACEDRNLQLLSFAQLISALNLNPFLSRHPLPSDGRGA